MINLIKETAETIAALRSMANKIEDAHLRGSMIHRINNLPLLISLEIEESAQAAWDEDAYYEHNQPRPEPRYEFVSVEDYPLLNPIDRESVVSQDVKDLAQFIACPLPLAND